MSAQTRRAELSAEFFDTARFNMVESQLRPNGVLDETLLQAMGRLPREVFVTEDAASFAYSDEGATAGFGRKLLSPMVFARLVQEAQLQPADRVLDVGAATGYSSAVLNEMVGEVIGLESDPGLCRTLQRNCQDFNLEHVRVVQGNLSDGYPDASPYQAIIIEGAVQWLPEALLAQMADGGRLLCVVSPPKSLPGQLGRAKLFEMRDGKITARDLFDASAPVLPAFAAQPKFEF
jgi:protein-L-isoaspartate(D-aspartate) O-methyltransferase